METDPDQLTKTHTIYQVSAGEIFWRNMVAGAGRAFGGIILQIVFFIIIIRLFNQYMMPALQPLVDTLQTATKQLENLQHVGRILEQ